MFVTVYTYAASAIVIAFHVKGNLDQRLAIICQWHFLNQITIYIVFIMDCTIAPVIVICVSYTSLLFFFLCHFLFWIVFLNLISLLI